VFFTICINSIYEQERYFGYNILQRQTFICLFVRAFVQKLIFHFQKKVYLCNLNIFCIKKS